MPAAKRFVCIHGHFYQPPRENPWLETVESQDSAAPYHDWNERITAECYAPNGAARIVDSKNEIIRILNNYARISFNFGPTLLSWLELNAPRIYRMILNADRLSRKHFSGHGSAMAQVYNHIIMPLANTRDRITQIRWGIIDFKHRFHRKPEGMWLPETAVDTESLELLAEEGIKFVVLAPHQCARVRSLTGPGANTPEFSWIETPNASADTTQPYVVRLQNGHSIAIFFYDGPRSRAIAFEGLLNSGENFAGRLLNGFAPNADRAQLVHVATDGESYGHHHKHGEMALSWALRWFDEKSDVRLTNYGEFLAKHPPAFEAQIVENSSWSCAHGVERWRSNCGCNGGRAGWNQLWRTPLREGLDWLRDSIAPSVKEAGGKLFKDIDAARNAYITVVLDRSKESIDRFLAVHAAHTLSQEERTTALQLMELERHAMLMYTSCGWFFDDISGIETVQIIAYAGRVLQLATDLFGEKASALETGFTERLAAAKSNVPEQGDGAAIYNHSAKNLRVGLEQVAAHYAISSVFTSYPDEAQIFCYTVRRLNYEVLTSGRGRVVIGQAQLCSNITEEAETVIFAALHFGDQNITAAVKRHDPSQVEAYEEFIKAARKTVIGADFPELIRLFDRNFGPQHYSIQSLFKDEQRRIVELILNASLAEVESSLTAIYEDHASLLHFLSQSGLPRPEALTLAATFAINAGLRRAIESDPIDALQMRAYRSLASADQVTIDKSLLSYLADQRMKRAMVELQDNLDNSAKLDETLLVARTLSELPFDLNLWQAQNIWYDSLKSTKQQQPKEDWMKTFRELGKQLHICVDELILEEDTANGNGSHAS